MTAATLTFGGKGSRETRIREELGHALKGVSAKELSGWGVASGVRFGTALWRRTVVLANVAVSAGQFTATEGMSAVAAIKEKRLPSHIHSLGQRTCESARRTGRAAMVAARQVPAIARAVKSNPADHAPRILGATIGMVAGSGGFDGDGGYGPDIDLFFGIGAHRSVWTHSFFITAAAEAVLLSAVELAELVHDKLPAQHHPGWDALRKHGGGFAEGVAGGYGVGVAYHLGVDGLFQPAAIKGLGVPLPMEAHQGLLTAFSVSEATYQVQGQAGKGER